MVDTVYIERDLLQHPRSATILDRLPRATRVEIDRWGEVFNPKAQNFRLQKQHPALILARKHDHQVLAAPDGYGVGGSHNYYFSHMLNCLYDCRYCFLQGMYRSAHQVVFINFEDYTQAIERRAAQHPDQPVWFYSGYDCDSLAYEPVTHFVDHYLPELARIPNAWLEIRTKSTQVRQLLHHPVNPRTVVAFSFCDEVVHRHAEHQVPSIDRRLDAMLKLAAVGWRLGLRFDPIIYHRDYQPAFRALLQKLFAVLPVASLHSVSLGNFRLPKQNFNIMRGLYPEEKIFNQPFTHENGMVTYGPELEQEMMSFCENELLGYIPDSIYFPCSW
jgi:spore photoproduct lyase